VIGERVVLLDRRRRIVLDQAGVREKFGVEPESIPDWLALVGDAADGLPGVPRFGKKSAATVLARYHHLEQIPARCQDWDVEVRGKQALAASLEEHRAAAFLWRRLAILRTDVPLGEDLAALRWLGARREPLEVLCAELEVPEFMAEITRWRVP
jgi:5'-3' exonuclease